MTTTATQETAGTQDVSILDKGIMLAVEFSRFGNRKKASLATVTTDAEKSFLSLSKRLFKCDEYTAVMGQERKVKNWLTDMALPFPVRAGAVLIPIPMMELTEDRMNEFRAEWVVLVDAFVAVYPQKIEEVRESLGSLYNALDYPDAEQVRERFTFGWQFLDYSVPGRLRSLNARLFESERAKMAEKISSATVEMQQMLRASMLELVTHMAERLTVDPTEGAKKKVFHASMVDKMRGFLDTFNVRNITGDADLEVIVQQARGLLEGVDPKSIRENEGLRDALAQSFTAMQATMDSMVVERTRRIRFDDGAEDSPLP